MFDSVIFREYDIRGVFDVQFDTAFAKDLARAFAIYVKEKRKVDRPILSVGYDARLSSPAIKEAVIIGLVESGCEVIELGLVTSPISYYSTFVVPNIDGGFMITGSHNPPEYNGFKISCGKSTIYGEEIQKLKSIVNSLKPGVQSSNNGTRKIHDILTPYVEQYAKEFAHLKNESVVFDCGNGAAGAVLGRLCKAIGLNTTILFEQPDGRFPNHHPDPTVEKNLVDLSRNVKEKKVKVGIGFDGDADRIGIVDETGKMVYGDELMSIVASDLLQTKKGLKIVGDVKCSDRMYNQVKESGGVPIMWKTGHSLIKEKIKEEKAPFGGEMSGHIFFADRNYGYDDAIYAGLRVLEILKKTEMTISQLLSKLPPSFSTPEIRIDTTEEKKILIVEKLKEKFSKTTDRIKSINLLDGIRISYEQGWGLARSSNTQPVLVVRFEATTQLELEKIQNDFMEVVNKYL